MLNKKYDQEFLKSKDGNLPADNLQIFLLDGGQIRGALVEGTLMLNAMRANHELGIIETLALGHAYLAAGLLSHGLTAGERIALQIDASGPLKGWVVEANAYGEVRGYLQRKGIDITAPIESFDLSSFIGIGFLKVTKYLKDHPHPFSGQVVLEHGNLAEDLAHYFTTSEQIPTAFNLSVFFDKKGRVRGAGGFYLQVLPGADVSLLDELTDKTESMPSLGKHLAEDGAGKDYLKSHFSSFSLELLENKPLGFFCHCSRERFAAYLASLPGQELEDMLREGPLPIVTTCHNCNSAYEFSREELEGIRNKK